MGKYDKEDVMDNVSWKSYIGKKFHVEQNHLAYGLGNIKVSRETK